MKMIGGVGSIGNLPFKAGVVNLESADMAALIGAASGLVKVLVGVGAGALALAFVAAIAEEEKIRKAEQIPIGVMSLIETQKRRFVGIPLNERLEFECENNHFEVALSKINQINHDWGIYSIEMIDNSMYEDVRILTDKLSFISVGGRQEIKLPSQKKILRVATPITSRDRVNRLVRSLKLSIPLGILSALPAVLKAKSTFEALENGMLPFFLTLMIIGLFAPLVGGDRINRREVKNESEMRPEEIIEERWISGRERRISKLCITGVGWEDIGALRQRLEFVLEHNAQAVVKKLGEDVFNQYFRYESARTIST